MEALRLFKMTAVSKREIRVGFLVRTVFHCSRALELLIWLTALIFSGKLDCPLTII